MEISNKIASLKHLYLMNLDNINIDEVLTHIAQLNNADVFWVDSEMKINNYHFIEGQDEYYEKTLNSGYLEINDFTFDITSIGTKTFEIGHSSLVYDNKDWGVKTQICSIPLIKSNSVFEFLVLFIYDKELEDNFKYFGEIISIIFSTIIQLKDAEKKKDTESQIVNVKVAIDALSYSEFEAAKCILNVLEGDEGYLVASRVADEYEITRSIIVNALRKLESAGLIKSKSLGMKGTHIKIINNKLREILDL